jgi:AraC family transcriptional regulator
MFTLAPARAVSQARRMPERPACYPAPPAEVLSDAGHVPRLDVLTSPVPFGVFQSPVDDRHVLCLHVGAPVPVSFRVDRSERQGVRLHGQFCVVPAGASTRWILTRPARSLLLRVTPALLRATAEDIGVGAADRDLSPAIHIRDPQIERIGWMMQAEEHDAYPGGRLFAESLASALCVRLLALQSRRATSRPKPRRALPGRSLRRVIDYIETHLDHDVSLAQLAQVAGFSVSHFKQLFTQATGMPVHRFVLARRVERARALVLEGDKPMTDIALELGFSHASHMARCMRRVLGTSPSELAASSGR